MVEREQISVIIPTKESDLELAEGAIKSVDWADEIILVDSSFSREAEKLAKHYGARYVAHKYIYSAKQKNWIIPQAKHQWILLVDSDEVVTKKLKMTILKLLESDEINRYDGYGIARKHFFFGKFLRYGGRYPLFNVRLFKRKCRYEDRDVHAHIVLEKDRVKNINPKDGDILHFSDRNINQFMEKFIRYGNYLANYMIKNPLEKKEIHWKKFFSNPMYFKAVVKDCWYFIPGSSIFRFFYMYFFRLGFLDGRYGLLIAILYALQDYVAKTRYYEITHHRPIIRLRLQELLLKRAMLLKGDILATELKCLNFSK